MVSCLHFVGCLLQKGAQSAGILNVSVALEEHSDVDGPVVWNQTQQSQSVEIVAACHNGSRAETDLLRHKALSMLQSSSSRSAFRYSFC